MRPDLIIDGQRKPKAPDKPIDLLDSVGVDRRMSPQPEVYEYSTFGPYLEAGGEWPDTVPMDRVE